MTSTWIKDLPNLITGPELQESIYLQNESALVDQIRITKEPILQIITPLGAYLTTESDVHRSRAISLLSKAVSCVPETIKTEADIHHLAEFFTSRLNDWPAIRGALQGCHALLQRSPHSDAPLTSQEAIAMMTVFIDSVYIRSLSVHDRCISLSILKHIVDTHGQALLDANIDLLDYCIASVDGEKDPRCLLQCFIAVRSIVFLYQQQDHSSLHAGQLESSLDELFDVLSCYFPINFTPPPNDPHKITRDQLAMELQSTLAALPRCIRLTVPLIIEKLSSTLKQAKIDALHLLRACIKESRKTIFPIQSNGPNVADSNDGDSETITMAQMAQIWSALRFEITAPAAPGSMISERCSAEETAAVAVQCLTDCVASLEKSSSRTPTDGPLHQNKSSSRTLTDGPLHQNKSSSRTLTDGPLHQNDNSHTHDASSSLQSKYPVWSPLTCHVLDDPYLKDALQCIASPGNDDATRERSVMSIKAATSMLCALGIAGGHAAACMVQRVILSLMTCIASVKTPVGDDDMIHISADSDENEKSKCHEHFNEQDFFKEQQSLSQGLAWSVLSAVSPYFHTTQLERHTTRPDTKQKENVVVIADEMLRIVASLLPVENESAALENADGEEDDSEGPSPVLQQHHRWHQDGVNRDPSWHRHYCSATHRVCMQLDCLISLFFDQNTSLSESCTINAVHAVLGLIVQQSSDAHGHAHTAVIERVTQSAIALASTPAGLQVVHQHVVPPLMSQSLRCSPSDPLNNENSAKRQRAALSVLCGLCAVDKAIFKTVLMESHRTLHSYICSQTVDKESAPNPDEDQCVIDILTALVAALIQANATPTTSNLLSDPGGTDDGSVRDVISDIVQQTLDSVLRNAHCIATQRVPIMVAFATWIHHACSYASGSALYSLTQAALGALVDEASARQEFSVFVCSAVLHAAPRDVFNKIFHDTHKRGKIKELITKRIVTCLTTAAAAVALADNATSNDGETCETDAVCTLKKETMLATCFASSLAAILNKEEEEDQNSTIAMINGVILPMVFKIQQQQGDSDGAGSSLVSCCWKGVVQLTRALAMRGSPCILPVLQHILMANKSDASHPGESVLKQALDALHQHEILSFYGKIIAQEERRNMDETPDGISSSNVTAVLLDWSKSSTVYSNMTEQSLPPCLALHRTTHALVRPLWQQRTYSLATKAISDELSAQHTQQHSMTDDDEFMPGESRKAALLLSLAYLMASASSAVLRSDAVHAVPQMCACIRLLTDMTTGATKNDYSDTWGCGGDQDGVGSRQNTATRQKQHEQRATALLLSLLRSLGMLVAETGQGKHALQQDFHTLLPSLLDLSRTSRYMSLREQALVTLTMLIKTYHYTLLHSYRKGVLKTATLATDDKKRSVRSAAAKCRDAWSIHC